MRPFLKLLDRRATIAVTLLTLALIGAIGGAARFMMPAFPTVILYLLPLAVGAWYGGRAVGLALVVISAAVWYQTDWLAKEQGVVVLWSGLTHFMLYAVIVLLIAAFRGYYREEKERATVDPLTGLLTRRAFLEASEKEFSRAQRYGHLSSVAYIDLDNFKWVNDTHGHAAGDALLKQVAEVIGASVRRTDFAARLGGDEFVVLFVETGTESARRAVAELRSHLLRAMEVLHYPVTFSIGVVTFEQPPPDSEAMIKTADELMYRAKQQGKNAVLHASYGSPTARLGQDAP